MIKITAGFSTQDLKKKIQDDIQSILLEISEKMFEAGQKVVDLARAKTKANGGFGNITWNLRSSIGCVLLFNHQIEERHIYFPPLSDGGEGRQKGINYAKEIALLVDDGDPVLIIVAGEEYAAYVEELHDLDVISGSTLKFRSLVNQVLNG